MRYRSLIDEVMKIYDFHVNWRRKCLNLIASENVMSPLVRSLLSSDFAHRYSLWDRKYIPDGVTNFYKGTKYLDEIYNIGVSVSCELFECEYADLRILSGHIGTLAVVMSLTNVGDTIYTVNTVNGGYPGLSKDGFIEVIGRRVIDIPFNDDKANIDVERLAEVVNEKGGKLIFIGSSFIPFIHPIEEIAEIAYENNLYFAYDASHVLGLIAGKVYPNPIKYGAVLVGSTHKTFPGPQGGILLYNSKFLELFTENIVMKVVDNPHYNRILALTVSIIEMLEFGCEYAKQIVANAKELARCLDEFGIPIKYRDLGYTETHQIILDDIANLAKFADKLEEANIIIDYSGRIGTCEITRLGFKEKEMHYIAELMKRVYDGENTSNIKKEVEKLTHDRKVEYTFPIGHT